MNSLKENPIFQQLPHDISEGAHEDSLIKNYKEEVPLLDEQPFQIQQIINTSVAKHSKSIISQNISRRQSLNDIVSIQESRRVNNHMNINEYQNLQHERGNIMPIANVLEAEIFHVQQPPQQFQRPFSNFRVFQKVSWWVLLIIFVISLATFVGIIAWMFYRRKYNSQVTYLNSSRSINVPRINQFGQNKKLYSNEFRDIQSFKTREQFFQNNLSSKTKMNSEQTIKLTKQQNNITIQSDPVNVIKQPFLKEIAPAQICSKNSFNLNNKCYSCPINQEWNGSNCIIINKHLRRI